MVNDNKSQVLEKGKVLLKLTSGKSLVLLNVSYAPFLRRNLIFGSLLNIACVKLVFYANKLVLARNSEFVWKGYVNSILFVLDIVTLVLMNKNPSFAYIVGFLNMWHCRLGHVGVGSINRLRKMNLLHDVIDDGLNK